MTKLNNLRSPLAGMLDARIVLCERIQVMAFKKVKSIVRAELRSNVDAISKSGMVEFPLRIRLDIIERFSDDAVSDWFENPSAEELDRLANSYCWWEDVASPIDEMKPTFQHILDAEKQRLKRCRDLGEITMEEESAAMETAMQACDQC